MAARALARAGALLLLALAAVHANWARGFAWPAGDRQQLARAVIGKDELTPGAACLLVAAFLRLRRSSFPEGRLAPRPLCAAGILADSA